MSEENPDPAVYKKGLFERLYAAGKEAHEALKKPLVKKALKRKLQSAYDDASKKAITAQTNLSKAHEDFESYDVNSVLQARQVIATSNEIQEEIKKEWFDLFGTEMRTDDED